MTTQSLNSIEQELSLFGALGIIVAVIWLILTIVFWVKVWFMLADVRALRDMVDDMHFRECARYESEKRRGLIASEDLDTAEELLKKL